MRQQAFGRIGLTLLVLCGARGQVFAETTFTWFDINPSRSNLDSDDPNGASGGRVNHVGAASDLSRVYAATEWGGLYQSFDQGNTWVKINTFTPSATWDVKVDPGNNQRVYATSFFDGRVNPQSGISISDDAGTTWRAVNIPVLNTLNCFANNAAAQPAAWQIAINPSNSAFVFVGTSCGLARSLDTGATWTFIDPSPGNLAEQIFAVIAHGPQIVDVVGSNGHFRSTDNGNTWSAAAVPPGPVAGVVGAGVSIAVSPSENYVLLAANTQIPAAPALAGINIWESQDGGATWPTSLTPPTLNGQSIAQNRIPFIKTNQLSASTQFDVWFGDTNLFKTTAITPSTAAPGGAQRTPQNSWTKQQDGAHWDVGDVMFDPRFAAGACPTLFTNDGGVYRNTSPNNPGCQGPSWDQPVITPHATWIWGLDGIRRQPGNHALTYGLQDDGGYAATVVAEGHNAPTPTWNNYFCCDVSHNSEGAGRMWSIDGSFNGGRAFRLYSRNLDGSGDNEIPTYPSAQLFRFGQSGKNIAPFGGNGYAVNITAGASPPPARPGNSGDVYFTNDITSNPVGWTGLSSPTAPTSGVGSLKIANLSGFPNVYYHSGGGNPENRGQIFRSTLVGTTGAPGSSWVGLPLPAGIGSVTAWDVDPTNGNRAIIAGIDLTVTSFQIHITQDFGVSWTRLTALENLMLSPGGTPTFLNRAIQGKNTGTFNFGTYWQPSLFKFNPIDPTTIVAGAIDAGVFLSLDDGATWESISNPVSPSSTSPHIPRPLFAYFSPGRFAADTSAFDVWVGTRGSGVMKVVLERPGPTP
jgi:hypothetical protein